MVSVSDKSIEGVLALLELVKSPGKFESKVQELADKQSAAEKALNDVIGAQDIVDARMQANSLRDEANRLKLQAEAYCVAMQVQADKKFGEREAKLDSAQEVINVDAKKLAELVASKRAELKVREDAVHDREAVISTREDYAKNMLAEANVKMAEAKAAADRVRSALALG